MFKERQKDSGLMMGKFLKNFGFGLVYIVFLPLLLAILALFGIYGIGVCVVEFFAGTIRFFQGKEPFPPLWEDAKVAEIKQAQMAAQLGTFAPTAPAPANPAGPSTVYVQQNYYNGQHPANGSTPAPSPAPMPIEGDAYFHDQRSQPPVIDVASQANPTLNQPSTPQIPANPASSSSLAGYIDISSDDPKGGSNS
jgi:hypothetical protein